ncbi:MAG: cytochrome c3 family protein [Nitrospirae bacterium]|nr:cytochrome c3 family protein [Nitrospirota bacterium]
MSKFRPGLLFLLLLFFSSTSSAQVSRLSSTRVEGVSTPQPQSKNAGSIDVHTWHVSKCSICHLASNPDLEPAALVIPDQSRLCESCHKDTVTILPSHRLQSDIVKMANHPIKFSPLNFDRKKINHNIVREGKFFYVSGDKGKVPLFGETPETAVAECATCHDPHGKSKLPKLARVDNSKNAICLACHLNY